VIPTVNFILKWVRGEVGAMKLDENLSEISLITKDAFEPTLPLSVVMHIDYKKAPMIIQRFGDVAIFYSRYLYETEEGGKREVTTGRVTEIFVLRNGKWTNPGWHTDTEK